MPQDDLKVDRKLSILINLLAYQIIQGKTLTDGVPVLRRLGLKQSEIAAVYDTTAGTVSVRLAEAKRRRTRSRGS
jgi:transcriptional regulator